MTVHPYVDMLCPEPGSLAPSPNPSCFTPDHIRICTHGQGHAVDRIGGLVRTREKVETDKDPPTIRLSILDLLQFLIFTLGVSLGS